jgi:hypothetical protein
VSGVLSFLAGSPPTSPGVPVAVSADNPLPVTLSGGIGGLSVAGTVDDGQPAAGQKPVTISGVDQATGNVQTVSVDASGALLTSGGGNVQGTVAQAGAVAAQNPVVTGGADGGGLARRFLTDTSGNTQVVGPAATATATVGGPVKVGGVQNTSIPLIGNGQVGDIQIGTRGSVHVELFQTNSTAAIGTLTNNTDANAASAGVPILSIGSYQQVYNGASWDRQAKPRTAFKLPTAAASNNAANIKAGPGTIYSISAFGAIAGPTWLKFFDTTGVPNPAALAQFYFFPIIAGLNSFSLPAGGLYFPTGVGVALVTGVADLNNTAVAAGDVLGLLVTFL